MDVSRNGPEGPAVHYGRLEDLLCEAQTASQRGSIVFVRAAINTLSNSGYMGIGEETRTILVVTALTLINDLPQYGQWVSALAGYVEVNGQVMIGEWTRYKSARLGELALQAAKNVILQDYGLQALSGQYMLSQEWLRVPGSTNLIDIELLRTLINPPDGMQAHQVPPGSGELLLGTINGSGHFEPFEGEHASLASDLTLKLCSPDLTSQWLVLPLAYKYAIASRQPGENPTTLYHPVSGWISSEKAIATAI